MAMLDKLEWASRVIRRNIWDTLNNLTWLKWIWSMVNPEIMENDEETSSNETRRGRKKATSISICTLPRRTPFSLKEKYFKRKNSDWEMRNKEGKKRKKYHCDFLEKPEASSLPQNLLFLKTKASQTEKFGVLNRGKKRKRIEIL